MNYTMLNTKLREIDGPLHLYLSHLRYSSLALPMQNIILAVVDLKFVLYIVRACKELRWEKMCIRIGTENVKK